MRINVSINMLFGIAAYYSRESAPAMPTTSGLGVVRQRSSDSLHYA
jgi:hypothetical protein